VVVSLRQSIFRKFYESIFVIFRNYGNFRKAFDGLARDSGCSDARYG
jgi:hypothetical protein